MDFPDSDMPLWTCFSVRWMCTANERRGRRFVFISRFIAADLPEAFVTGSEWG